MGDLLFAPLKPAEFGRKIVTSPVSLAFEDVSFAYPGRGEATLQHINMTLKQGRKSGDCRPERLRETTLLRLISGCCSPHRAV